MYFGCNIKKRSFFENCKELQRSFSEKNAGFSPRKVIYVILNWAFFFYLRCAPVFTINNAICRCVFEVQFTLKHFSTHQIQV